MAEVRVMEGCEGFAFPGGPVGAVVVHGLTSSPQSVLGLGEHLRDAGLAVVGPRLAGHGTTWQDMGRTRFPDWIASVEDAFEDLAGRTDEVFLVGQSIGAVLCLNLAERLGDRIAGVVAMCPYILTKDPRRHLTPILGRLPLWVPGVANDIADPGGQEIAYARVSTKAAASMLALMKQTRENLHEVTAPLLVMHSRNDHVAHPSGAQLVHDQVSSDDKELIWYDRSFHVLSLDYDRHDVARRIVDFIGQRARSAV